MWTALETYLQVKSIRNEHIKVIKMIVSQMNSIRDVFVLTLALLLPCRCRKGLAGMP